MGLVWLAEVCALTETRRTTLGLALEMRAGVVREIKLLIATPSFFWTIWRRSTGICSYAPHSSDARPWMWT